MFLVDTNVWLERLLEQARSEEVGQFLSRVSSERLFVSDFAFHSIAMILSRLKKTDDLLRFVQDAFIDGAITLIRLEPEDTARLTDVMKRFNLDFDDAYQYVAAEKFALSIVSFDEHFEKTERGRRMPSEVS